MPRASLEAGQWAQAHPLLGSVNDGATRRYSGDIGQKWSLFCSGFRFGFCDMTAIAVVVAPWGVLMAADGRVAESDGSPPFDGAQKIIHIHDQGSERNAMYALIGTVSTDGFDIRDEFLRQTKTLSDYKCSDPCAYVGSVCESVTSAVNEARFFPESTDKTQTGRWKIVEAAFCGCFGPLVSVIVAELSHLNGLASFRISHYKEDSPVRLLIGPGKVCEEMYRQGDFAAIPNSRFSEYIYNLGSDPSVSQARNFAVGYIEACCSPLAACDTVGGHIHAATIKPRAGFKWIIPPLPDVAG
jgi:hypothetical protein